MREAAGEGGHGVASPGWRRYLGLDGQPSSVTKREHAWDGKATTLLGQMSRFDPLRAEAIPMTRGSHDRSGVSQVLWLSCRFLARRPGKCFGDVAHVKAIVSLGGYRNATHLFWSVR